MNTGFLGPAVATVLTVYGIETQNPYNMHKNKSVATVLTVYGIETTAFKNIYGMYLYFSCNSTYRLRY